MSRSFELDPDDVLMHLNELGYHNIQPQQLEEFIRDLKKLIKHDMSKKNVLHNNQGFHDTSSTLPNTTDESVSPSPPPQPSQQNLQRKQRLRHPSEATKSKGTQHASSSSSDCSILASSRILRECTKSAIEKNREKENVLREKSLESSKTPSKPVKSCGSLWKRIGCKCCDEYWSKEQQSIKSTKSKENLAPRPKSSFIRTWQSRPGSAPQRCDPVSLYQHYQQVWKQQKLPGENNHNDLRWMIRERMLGQEPHPRPLSQASSLTSMSSRRKRL